MSRLLDAAGDAPFIFVTGKGGTGKTTAAGGLSLELADSGTATHLISTDPAHSIADLLGQPVGGRPVTSQCSQLLTLEEFDATAAGDAWVERSLASVIAIVETGTYLDGEDVTAFSRLALPGLDEMMAVLRLVEIADARAANSRVVVDTAPTGHTLRLLDAADTHEGIARALRAMADKAAAVAGAMTGRAVRMKGEDLIEGLERVVRTYRERVLAPAAFIVASRSGAVVEAETERLAHELERRKLRIAAVVSAGGSVPRAVVDAVHLLVPRLEDVTGCDGLRSWRRHVDTGRATDGGGTAAGRTEHGLTPGPGPQARPRPHDREAGVATAAGRHTDAAGWLSDTAPGLLLFAGKGGVGKSTCAAAAALALAGARDVLLCSTDPAGSLGDVLDTADPRPADRLRVMQIEPATQVERLRVSWEQEVAAALERLGLSEAAALDRRVIETLWELTPPGLDELAATAAMLGAADTGETVVIDSSPTGHFLRLLDMPEIALGWTRQLMRIFVKYGIAGSAEGAAQSLLELSRELRALRDTLHDPERAGVIIVTLEEPMVRAETTRLATSLEGAGVRVLGVLVNHAAGAEPPGSATVVHSAAHVALRAPSLDPPPIGVDALRGFAHTWKIVA